MLFLHLPITARGVAILCGYVVGMGLVVWAVWVHLGPGVAVLLLVLLLAQVASLVAAFRSRDE
ncbi:hypothetical protein FHR81_003188 [Actinoalloteichus hoggarensis]|uniref:Uncharacterized protein n=1 Tax=Actinoalloteichus hoggarensis TaxID=1470176 RepID=A0A221W6Q0_9PSEU|nr:hypothetical protein [Actinoalloteichus hoggarensis]ASO21545.1 hypothetical protein AHOG_19615 [Actinoalloteichus hoggarensis]MBB5922136.1 hypothetical protein [Actinoalloteichus hoggarensis]